MQPKVCILCCILEIKRYQVFHQALPTVKLFAELEALIRSYPCQLRLRITLLDHVYSLLQEVLPDDPRAIQVHATRQLRGLTLPKENDKHIVEDDPHVVDSEKLIDALQSANERLSTAVKASWGTSTKSDSRTATHPNMSEIYADFVSEWCRSPTLEPNLVRQIPDLVLVSLDNRDYVTETVFNRVSTGPRTGLRCITSLASHAHSFAPARQHIAEENIEICQEVFNCLALFWRMACPTRCRECV